MFNDFHESLTIRLKVRVTSSYNTLNDPKQLTLCFHVYLCVRRLMHLLNT